MFLKEWLIDRPAAIRWIGLVGSVLLGIDAFLFGAGRTIRPSVSPQTVATGPNGIAIMTLWILGTAGLAGAWWFGRGLTGRVSARWVVVTASLWMLPMLVIPPIASRDVYAYSCQGALYAAGGNPYHQGVSALPCPWLDSVSTIWRDTPTPYGPVFNIIAGAFAQLGSLTAAIIAFRLLAVAGVVLIAVSIPPIARRIGLPVERSLWLVLACPLVVIHLIGGAHNDAITIGLLLAALAVIVARYERFSGLVYGGVLLGLSIAVKPMIIIAVPFVVLYVAGGADAPVAASRTGRGPFGFPALGDVFRRGGAVLASAFGTLLVVTLISGLGFGWTTALLHGDSFVAWTSPSSAVGTSINALLKLFGVHANTVPVTHDIGLVLLPISLVLIFWRARWTDRFYAAGIALLAVTFFSPTVQPWYLIWPLVLLSLTAARAGWFAVAVIVASYAAMTNGVGLDGLARLPLSIAMTAATIWALIAGLAWVRGRNPRLDDFGVVAPSGALEGATTPKSTA